MSLSRSKLLLKIKFLWTKVKVEAIKKPLILTSYILFIDLTLFIDNK